MNAGKILWRPKLGRVSLNLAIFWPFWANSSNLDDNWLIHAKRPALTTCGGWSDVGRVRKFGRRRMGLKIWKKIPKMTFFGQKWGVRKFSVVAKPPAGV